MWKANVDNFSLRGLIHCRRGSLATLKTSDQWPGYFFCRGMTLIELLVAMAIAASLLSIGVAPLTATVKSLQMRAFSNSFLEALYLARSEAIKRGSRVVVCKSPDGTSCLSLGGWDQGWIVFHDANNDGAHQTSEEVILNYKASAATVHAFGNGNVSKYISYTHLGTAELTSGAFQAGSVTICSLFGQTGEERKIVINASGRARVTLANAQACL
jgi:type IV fimbrial biogenesis protein FimT